MALVEHDDMIETIATDGTDQPLNEWILPGRARCGDHSLDAQVLDPLLEDRTVDRVAITNQEPWGMVSFLFIPTGLSKRARCLFGVSQRVSPTESQRSATVAPV